MHTLLSAAALAAMTSPVDCATIPRLEQGSSRSTQFGCVHVDAESADAAVEEGEAAYSAARRFLALPDARFAIVDADYTAASWGDQSPDRVPIYVWTFRKSANLRAFPPPAYLLRHEIGHDLFIRYLVPSTRSVQYGGDAPDWLDEMAAVAFEGDVLRASRRRAAAGYAREAKLIPLRRFLTMIHPEMEAGSIPSADQQVAVFEAVSDETPQFYAMACAFYDFLVNRTENVAIVAELAGAFRNGEKLDEWLLARTGQGDRASGIEALNADFLAWIASDIRYGGDPSP